MIGDPSQPRFYGQKNDRMPAYRESLSREQIEILADWLRGEWYEPRPEK